MKKEFFLVLAGILLLTWSIALADNLPVKIMPNAQTATVATAPADDDLSTARGNNSGSTPHIATVFLQDDFSDGDYTNNPTWTRTSNGNGNGTEDWAVYPDPWVYAYGTVTNHASGYLMGSNSDGGGAIADETMSVQFNTDGTGSLRVAYWLYFRAYVPAAEYFDVLIDGNVVEHFVAPDQSENIGIHTVGIQAYNDGATHTLSFHYYADYGYVAAFDDVVILNDVIAECPPNGIAENEPDCYPGYVDLFNGGCSYYPPQFGPFTPIAPGDTICGESGVIYAPPDSSRDNDWYEVTLPGLRHVHWDATSNFPFLIYIYQPGPGLTCPATILIYGYTTSYEGDTVRVEYDLPAGTYWLRVRPYDYNPAIVCGQARYVAWFNVDPPLLRDARVVSVDNPQYHRVAAGEAGPINVTVTNYGEDATYDFNVTVDIVGEVSGPVYTSTRTASNVGQLQMVQLTFDNFTPTCVENYTMTVTCDPTGDQVPDNNTLTDPFRAIALGWDAYTDGTTYWVLPTSIVAENCVRFRVPAGHTAALSQGAILLSVTPPAPGGPVTPKIYDNDGVGATPGTVLWTGTPINVTASGWVFVDLTGAGLAPTHDFFFGYSTTSTGPYVYGDPALDYTQTSYSYYGTAWTASEDIWTSPTDYYIWMNYDITGGVFLDGEATSINSPNGVLLGSGPFNVSATFTNAGASAISNASATATVTGPGGQEFTATVLNVTLAPGGSTTIDFGNWTAGQSLVYYDVVATLTVSGDQNVCNNSTASRPYVLSGDVVYSKDFEADNGGLTQVVISGPPIWQWGVDALTGAHSGTKVWGTILNGNYLDAACAALRTAPIAIPAAGGALAFYSWYRTEDAWDFCNVKISVDGGTTFTLLTPLTGYDGIESGYLCTLLQSQAGFTGIHPAWTLQAFDLAAYAGMNAVISFDFGSDSNTNDRGFYIDDLMILTPPVGGCSYVVGDANGNGSFNGLDVVYSVTYFKGGPPPPYSCECTPGSTWYVAGDVNASCNYNGLDVSYMVSYLKGGPPPHPCASCPPAR